MPATVRDSGICRPSCAWTSGAPDASAPAGSGVDAHPLDATMTQAMHAVLTIWFIIRLLVLLAGHTASR